MGVPDSNWNARLSVKKSKLLTVAHEAIAASCALLAGVFHPRPGFRAVVFDVYFVNLRTASIHTGLPTRPY